MLIDPCLVDDRVRADEAVSRLEDALARGGWLTPLDACDLPLDDGERLYAQLPLRVHCLCRVRDVCERRPMIAATGLGWWIAVVAAYVKGRPQQRGAAAGHVRWVDLGSRVVFLTNHRTMFVERGELRSCLPHPSRADDMWVDDLGRSLRLSGAWATCAASIRRFAA